jgi:hypothetical protein
VHAEHEVDTVTVQHSREVFEGQIRAKLHEMGFDVTGYADRRQARP